MSSSPGGRALQLSSNLGDSVCDSRGSVRSSAEQGQVGGVNPNKPLIENWSCARCMPLGGTNPLGASSRTAEAPPFFPKMSRIVVPLFPKLRRTCPAMVPHIVDDPGAFCRVGRCRRHLPCHLN